MACILLPLMIFVFVNVVASIPINPPDFKEDLSAIFAKFKSMLKEEAPDPNAYQNAVEAIRNMEDEGMFQTAVSTYRTTSFLWSRVKFLSSILQQKIYSSNFANFSAFGITQQQTDIINFKFMQAHQSFQGFFSGKISEKNRKEAIGFVNAYKMFEKTMKYDTRKLSPHEKQMQLVVQRTLPSIIAQLVRDQEMRSLLIPDEAPHALDQAQELDHWQTMEFLNSLTEIERDVVKAIGGVTVVNSHHQCSIFTKIGKWFIGSTPCYR